MAGLLTEAGRNAALAKLTDWTFADNAIRREFAFKNFSEAFGFMTRVALLVEAADHHPEWSNTYSKVEIVLTTHDAGGVSQKDMDLAQEIDALLA
jgi:4a-hydroxytetrahydrobiopterin dehydratase